LPSCYKIFVTDLWIISDSSFNIVDAKGKIKDVGQGIASITVMNSKGYTVMKGDGPIGK
jgi:hypothetical protein